MAQRKQSDRKSNLRLLGLERMEKLTKASAKERAKVLEKNLENGKYKGQTMGVARRYMYWYRSFANKKAA